MTTTITDLNILDREIVDIKGRIDALKQRYKFLVARRTRLTTPKSTRSFAPAELVGRLVEVLASESLTPIQIAARIGENPLAVEVCLEDAGQFERMGRSNRWQLKEVAHV
jgi:hypothetical protein